VTQVVLTNACLGFWGSSISKGQKTAILGKIFELVLSWWLHRKEYGKSKTIGFITDYLTIFTPNFVGNIYGRSSLVKPAMLLTACGLNILQQEGK